MGEGEEEVSRSKRDRLLRELQPIMLKGETPKGEK